MKVMLLSLYHNTKVNYPLKVWKISQHGFKRVNHLMMCLKRRYSTSYYIDELGQFRNRWPSKVLQIIMVLILLFYILSQVQIPNPNRWFTKNIEERKWQKEWPVVEQQKQITIVRSTNQKLFNRFNSSYLLDWTIITQNKSMFFNWLTIVVQLVEQQNMQKEMSVVQLIEWQLFNWLNKKTCKRNQCCSIDWTIIVQLIEKQDMQKEIDVVQFIEQQLFNWFNSKTCK